MATIPLDIVANVNGTLKSIRKLESNSKDAFGGITGAIGKLSIGITGLNQGFQLASAGARFLADGLKATVGQALEFEESIAEISTLLNDASVGTEQLGKTVLDLQKKFGGKQKVIAGAFYNAISSGAVEAANANKFLADANKLAVGGVTTLETAVDGLTTIISGFGLEAEDTKEISDSLFIAMQKGKTTVGELSRGVGIAAASASSLGVDFKELLAATSALTTGGLTTSVAFTQVRSALVGLSKPSIGLQKILDDLNITSIKAQIEQDGMVGTLKKIIAETDGSAEAMGKLFGSVEAVQGVTALTSDTIGGTFKNALEQMKLSSENSGEATSKAFRKIADTAAFQFKKLKGIIDASFTGIGKEITKRISPVLKLLQKVAKGLGEGFKKGLSAASKALSKSKLFSASTFEKTLVKGIKISIKAVALLVKAFKFLTLTILDAALAFENFVGVEIVLNAIKKIAIKIAQGMIAIKNASIAIISLPSTIGQFFSDEQAKKAEAFAATVEKGRKEIARLNEVSAKPINLDFSGVKESIDLMKGGIEEVGFATEIALETVADTFAKEMKTVGDEAGKIAKKIKPDAEGDRRLGQLSSRRSNEIAAEIEIETNTSGNKFAKNIEAQGINFGKAAIGSFQKGGKEGAKQLIGSAASAVGNALGIPVLGPIMELLMTDGAANLIQGVADNLPVIVETIAENLPLISAKLIEILGDPTFGIRIANAFIDGYTKSIDKVAAQFTEKFKFAIGEGFINMKNNLGRLGVSIRNALHNGITNFASDFKKAWIPVRDEILGPFKAVGDVFTELADRFKALVSQLTGGEGSTVDKAKDIGKRVLVGVATGGLSEVARATGVKIPGLADGGIVPSGFNNDTFSANLTSGEAVIKRDTTEELANFLSKQGSVEAILNQLVEIVSAPIEVNTSINIDGENLGEAILNLNRQNTRLA